MFCSFHWVSGDSVDRHCRYAAYGLPLYAREGGGFFDIFRHRNFTATYSRKRDCPRNVVQLDCECILPYSIDRRVTDEASMEQLNVGLFLVSLFLSFSRSTDSTYSSQWSSSSHQLVRILVGVETV
jgi:hypothetical protein